MNAKTKAQTIDLKVENRADRGKSSSRALRRNGRLPAVLYGEGRNPLNLSLDLQEMRNILSSRGGERSILSIVPPDSKNKPHLAMIKEIQQKTISREILHVDLLRVSLDKKVEVRIPVEILGADAVKKRGGIIQQTMSEITVECLPEQIPESVTAEMKDCEIGDAITVKNLRVSEEITILADADEVIASVVAPAKIEEKPVEAEEAAAVEGEVPVEDAAAEKKTEEVKPEGEKKRKGREEKK